MHDSMYWLAQHSGSKEEQERIIRMADERMVNTLERFKKEKVDDSYNINVGLRLIQLKMVAEDVSLLEKGSFGGKLQKPNAEDMALVKGAIKKLQAQGL